MGIFISPGEILGSLILQLLKILVALALPFVIYVYFFTKDVKEYFNLTEVSNTSMIFNHVGFSIVLAIIYSWLT